ncbi:MAG TPA: hypothetical protein PKE20_08680 [Promineifilum sp.]|nr:hypothetical protein [Promineifilum sp.]
MADKLPSRSILDIREALNELLRHNDRTRDREVGDMYLGSDIFVVRLKRPRVVEGSWEDLDRTIDLFDLIEAHQKSDGSLPSGSNDKFYW